MSLFESRDNVRYQGYDSEKNGSSPFFLMKLPFLTKVTSDLRRRRKLEHKNSDLFACHLELLSPLVITFMDTGSYFAPGEF